MGILNNAGGPQRCNLRNKRFRGFFVRFSLFDRAEIGTREKTPRGLVTIDLIFVEQI